MDENSKTRQGGFFRRLFPGVECETAGPSTAQKPASPKTYTEAEVKDQDLSGQSLTGASLIGLNFGAANLRGAILHDADLAEADLRLVKNLLPEQLSGTNLSSAQLPDPIKPFEALGHVEALSQNAGKLLVSLLAACAFMALTIGHLTALQLVTGSITAKLPVVDAEIGVKPFFVFGPIIILGVYFAFHLYLQRLWETLAILPAIFPDGTPLDRKTYPWLVNDLVRLHFLHLKQTQRRLPMMYFQEKLWGFVIYWLPCFLLLPFWAHYLCCRNWAVTSIHILCLAASVWFAVMFSYLACITLERDREKIKNWQSDWLKNNGSRLAAWAISVSALFFLLSLSAFNSRPSTQFPPRLAQIVPWTLEEFQASPFIGPHGAVSLAGTDLSGLDLEYADLENTDLTDANLEGARLNYARLDYSVHKKARNWFFAYYDSSQCLQLGLPLDHNRRLEGRLRGGKTDLSGYNLSGASLERASLADALLQGANLQSSDLGGADLHSANLTGGSLRGANLSGADMFNAILTDTDVQGANFQSALLTAEKGETNHTIMDAVNWLLAHYNAKQLTDLGLPIDHETHLTRSNFDAYQLGDDDLHGSNFKYLSFHNAVFWKADLHNADLRETQFQGANFYGADLRNANLTGADLTGATFTGAKYNSGTQWPTPDFPLHHPEMILQKD